MTNILLP